MFFLLISLLAVTPTGTWMQKLDNSRTKGLISSIERLNYIETAIKNPSSLPKEWRDLLKVLPFSEKSITSELVNAYQARQKLGLRELYSMPQVPAYYVDSATLPIRVYYGSESLYNKAIITLEAAEYSWEKEINEWGFYSPPIVAPEGKYRFYLGDAAGAAGFTSPLNPIPETPWDDCATYIVIESTMSEGNLHDTVAHELNHATQGAIDCMEPVTFWENTAVFTENAVYPGSISGNRWFAYYFQSNPQYSLSENQSPYWYGGFIWPTFLAETYGDGWDDAVFVREIWEGAMQETNNTENTVTYLQSIDSKLKGLNSSLHEAFHKFSASRYFVDEMYDPNVSTMPNGDLIYPVPPIVESVDMDTGKTIIPSKALWPKPYGVNYYIYKRPKDYSRISKIKIVTYDEDPWTLQIVPMHDLSQAKTVDSSGMLAEIEFDPSETGDVLVVVEHLSDENFNPNHIPAEGTKYSITFGSAVPLPEISMISPEKIEAGEESTINIYGANFQDGAEIELFPDDNIEIKSVEFISQGKLTATLIVPKDALTGVVTLIVRNPDGGEDSLEYGLLVEEPPPAPKKDDSFWSCNSSNSKELPPVAFFLMLLPLFFIRRIYQ